jgi:YHS domain-containing protein
MKGGTMRISMWACVAVWALACGAARAGDKDQVEADKKALSPVLQYVGGWRGAGLPKDGSKDGWSEDSEWQFDLKGGHAALVFSSEKGRYYKSGRIDPGEKAGEFKFTGVLPDGKKEEMVGTIIENKEERSKDLVFNNAAPGTGRPARVVFSVVAKGNRLLMDYQKKMSGDRYAPIAEVGYTRKGSNFGKSGDSHECVITGGAGKIEVSYKGQTYWVCCGGCKDAFNENPEKEIAAYHKRKEEEKLKDKQ